MEENSFFSLENISDFYFKDDLLDGNSSLNGNLGSDSLSDLLPVFKNERPITIINSHPEKSKIFDVKKMHSPGRKRKSECLKKKRHNSNDTRHRQSPGCL